MWTIFSQFNLYQGPCVRRNTIAKYRFALLFKVLVIMIALARAVKMNVVNLRHSFPLNVENDPAARVACRVSIECRKKILLHVRAHLSTFLSLVGRGIGWPCTSSGFLWFFSDEKSVQILSLYLQIPLVPNLRSLFDRRFNIFNCFSLKALIKFKNHLYFEEKDLVDKAEKVYLNFPP